MMKQFKIIVPSFNSVDYISKTLKSIEIQTYKNYQVCVINDGSTLPKQNDIITEFSKRNGWTTISHPINKGALFSIVDGISALNCVDDDVIVLLDGDDWFAHDRVLQNLFEIYSDKEILLTWGKCESYPPNDPPRYYGQSIPDRVITNKLYRNIPFVFWHPRTFKFLLWQKIDQKDFIDTNGEFFKIQWDKAIIFPLLEMAGEKIFFVNEIHTIYNQENPLNDFNNTPHEEHQRVDELIRSKPKYSTFLQINEK